MWKPGSSETSAGKGVQVEQDLTDKAIDQWLDRISLIIQSKGGHTEHRLD